MIFMYYFVMRAALNLRTHFNLIISFLFSFILTSIKENPLVYSQHYMSIKKTKLWQHRIFTASKMPLSQPILNKAPLRDFPLLQPLRPVPLRLLNLLNLFLQRL